MEVWASNWILRDGVGPQSARPMPLVPWCADPMTFTETPCHPFNESSVILVVPGFYIHTVHPMLRLSGASEWFSIRLFSKSSYRGWSVAVKYTRNVVSSHLPFSKCLVGCLQGCFIFGFLTGSAEFGTWSLFPMFFWTFGLGVLLDVLGLGCLCNVEFSVSLYLWLDAAENFCNRMFAWEILFSKCVHQHGQSWITQTNDTVSCTTKPGKENLIFLCVVNEPPWGYQCHKRRFSDKGPYIGVLHVTILTPPATPW